MILPPLRTELRTRDAPSRVKALTLRGPGATPSDQAPELVMWAFDLAGDQVTHAPFSPAHPERHRT
eukprot:IDg21580t1